MAQPTETSIGSTLASASIATWADAHSAAAGKRSANRDRSAGERLIVLSILLDTIIVLAAMLGAFWLRFHTPIHAFGVMSDVGLRAYAGHIGLGTVSMLFILAYRQLYTKGVMLRYRKVARLLFESTLIWTLGFLSISLILKFQPPVSRLYVAVAGACTLSGMLVWRCVLNHALHRWSWAASLRQRVLIVGWNEESQRLFQAFGSDHAHAYDLVGCVTPAGRDFTLEPPAHTLVLGSEANVAEIVETHGVDIVMVADMSSGHQEIVALANLCEKMMVQFKVIPNYFQILVSGLHLETVSGIPILGVSRLPLDRTANIVLKRCVDIIGSLAGLAISMPVMAVFGFLVYRESPGPVFYRQRRLGRNGREFFIYKIRSMRLDAEAPGKVGWTTKNDPRRLRIGEFMRKWNIDEVPQFWNVLKGEMSLVGPRPERPELIRNFKDEIPHYNARHNCKPGITGWAQVKGFRGDTDLGERIKCDLFYLENWNLLLDFQIMVMTFFRRENAC